MNHIGTKFVLAQRYIFDPNNNYLIDQSNDNEIIRMGSNESRILLMLSQQPNQIISRSQLHEFVWRDQGFEVDDSSLTQAISTLRKMLGDSTKHPQFVKTVPKRGYQFIAHVEDAEQALAQSAEEDDNNEPELKAATADTHSFTERETTTDKTIQNYQLNISQKNTGIRQKWAIKIMIAIAILLPLFVYLSVEPAASEFRTFDSVNSIPIQTVKGHPPLEDKWGELIKRCSKYYIESHPAEEKPETIEAIIVTAGQRNNIILNIVHSEEHSDKNMTIQLVAERQELDEFCR